MSEHNRTVETTWCRVEYIIFLDGDVRHQQQIPFYYSLQIFFNAAKAWIGGFGYIEATCARGSCCVASAPDAQQDMDQSSTTDMRGLEFHQC